jgi:chemotaxis signal transduction protein
MRAILPALAKTSWFGLDALAVQEVLGARTWIALPHASLETPGVLAWRGRAVAVLDVGRLLDQGATLSGSSCARALVIDAKECTLAIPVDGVREVHEVTTGAIRPSERAPRIAPFEVAIDSMFVPLLDLEQVIVRLLRDHPGDS